MGLSHRAGLTALIAAGACLAAATPAFGLGFTNLSSAPTDVTAGAHSNFTQHIEFTNATDDVKNLVVHLPPGQVGDPTATPKCTVAELNAFNCPANTQVGTTTTSANLLDVVPLSIPGKVYNLVPQPGEPARFGIILTPPVGGQLTLQAGASLRPDDFGLDTIINDIPNTADGMPISITALDLTLFGIVDPGPPQKSFMRNPTSCGLATTEFDATPYSGAAAHGSASFTPTNCGALDFSPELSSTVEGVDEGGYPAFSTTIAQEATEAGLKRAEVYLPIDLKANNSALDNTCSPAEFQAGNCPAGTQKGTATATSPLLTAPLTGEVYLMRLTPTDLGVGLDLHGELAFKLLGKFVFTPEFQTGNLFEGLPDIPISVFTLNFTGGTQGLSYAGRDLCEDPTPVFDYIFDGHNGEQTTGHPAAQVTGCVPPAPPTATVILRAKDTNSPRLKLTSHAGSEELRSARIKLPKGLRFAAGNDLLDAATAKDDSGVLDDDAIEATRRRLTVTTPAGGGSEVLKLKAGRGALIKTGKPRSAFPLKITDVEGLVTSLTG